MPKIISNLDQNIIDAAKEILTKKGFEAMNIRDIAEKCNIALGTVYNYYPSKYEIVNAMVVKDWNESIAELDKTTGHENDILLELKMIFEKLQVFFSSYHSIWVQIYMQSDEKKSFGDIHKSRMAVMSELSGLIKNIFVKNGSEVENIDFLSDFLGQTLCSYCSRKDFEFSDLEKIIKKLI